MNEEIFTNLDTNNHKAMEVCRLTIKALENELEDVNVISSLEVIFDYLKTNDDVFCKKVM